MTQEALEHSRETRHHLNTHIELTGFKLDMLATNITRLETALKWAGSIIVSLMLTVLGWALVQQINANESQKKDIQQQLDLLRAQEIQQAQELPASASHSTVAPRR